MHCPLFDVNNYLRRDTRWPPERQKEEDERRRELREAPFRNVVEWAAWPRIEILKVLKSRSRGLSIQEMADGCSTMHAMLQ